MKQTERGEPMEPITLTRSHVHSACGCSTQHEEFRRRRWALARPDHSVVHPTFFSSTDLINLPFRTFGPLERTEPADPAGDYPGPSLLSSYQSVAQNKAKPPHVAGLNSE